MGYPGNVDLYGATSPNPVAPVDPNAVADGQTEYRPVTASDGTFLGYARFVYDGQTGQWFQIGQPESAPRTGGGGTAGPDFISIAQLKLQEYLAQMSGQEGAADIAHKQWLTEIGNIRIELDRQTAEATRALGVQQEVTNRAKIFAQDILPGLLPVTQLDIKDLYGILGGPYQGMKLDIPAMFDQGTGGLGSVTPLPKVDLSGITPFPATKTIPAPDLSAFLQAAGGW